MKKLLYSFLTLSLTLLIFNVTICKSTLLDDIAEQFSIHLFTSDKPIYFLVVDKGSQKLLLFEHDQKLKLLNKFTCATGENPGNKIFSGDSRTPEGIYFITEVYEDKKITVFGSRAFHLNYPNVFDTHSGRQGDGIFIHGTNKKLIPYSTNGCITLDNGDLDKLAPYLAIDTVPVIVVDTAKESISNHTFALKKSDPNFNEILGLLNIYNIQSPQFSSENISSTSFIRVGSQAVASIAYKVFNPNSMEYLYKKRVYLSPTSDNSWRSLYGLHFQEVVPKILAIAPIKRKLKVEPDAIEPPTQLQKGNELLKFVEKWRSAWSSKDIYNYMSCYSPSFKNGRLNYAGWKKKKTYLNQKYKFIRVNIRNIVVEWTARGANVSFFQSYQSDKYQTTGKKLLKLVHDNDTGWLIQKEIM